MSLLGDFGGFIDACTLIFGLVTSFYSSSMFSAAIASDLPNSNEKHTYFSKEERQHIQRVREKVVEGGLPLDANDLSILSSLTKRSPKRSKSTDSFKALFFCKPFCKHDR